MEKDTNKIVAGCKGCHYKSSCQVCPGMRCDKVDEFVMDDTSWVQSIVDESNGYYSIEDVEKW